MMQFYVVHRARSFVCRHVDWARRLYSADTDASFTAQFGDQQYWEAKYAAKLNGGEAAIEEWFTNPQVVIAELQYRGVFLLFYVTDLIFGTCLQAGPP